jgi:hypothetical protein
MRQVINKSKKMFVLEEVEEEGVKEQAPGVLLTT